MSCSFSSPDAGISNNPDTLIAYISRARDARHCTVISVRCTAQVVLSPYDRVAIGGELLLFKWKALETKDTGPIPTAEEAVMEFKRAIQVS